jgi:hypothetical protein
MLIPWNWPTWSVQFTMLFSIITKSCTISNFRTFSPPLKETQYPLSGKSCSQAITNLPFFFFFFFFVRLGFELRALPLQSRCSTAWATPLVLFALVIVEMGSHELFARQTRVRESLGLTENIWPNVTFQIDHALAQRQLRPLSPPIPSPFIDYWTGITWFFPSHRLAQVLNTCDGQKHAVCLQIPLGPTMLPFVPFPNF